MQNTSGILPSSSSSAADPSPAPTNAEPQTATVMTTALATSTSDSTSSRRIAVPRSQKAVHCPDECTTAVVTPMEAASASILPLVTVVEEPTKDSLTAPTQGNKRRCWTCKGKISLSAVTCRCGYTFCNRHRYAEEHDCLFDFRQMAKRKLAEENPRVVPLKVARIN
ncbi:hypothetical protein AaE_016317 [Aphanomyces astaci]|uniref:AN1-type domain-containing protein n=1 Tax=Aphanomyces astaci TaxID=112090 RepID=A0A6A4YZ96_APHAT|nr:hypothetical protein AaE_016317 [Aphanomyces astaci]